jgi:intein/homing endonuclease
VTPLGARFCAEALLHECCHLFAHDSERADEHGVAPRDRMMFNVACFPAGTLLPGNTPIESVATIVNHFEGNLVSVRSAVGEVSATPEHPFFAKTRKHKKGLHPIILNAPEWIEAGNLTDSDYICVPKITDKRFDTTIDLTQHGEMFVRRDSLSGEPQLPNRMIKSIPLDVDTAWLIGLYVAEGSASQRVTFSLASYEDEIIERVEKIAFVCGWTASRYYDPRQRACQVSLGAVVFGRWLKEHCGDGAKNKHIPDVILRHADEEIRLAFLEGLNDGDGYTSARGSKKDIKTYLVGTSSKSLMHDVVLLLAQSGVGCSTAIQAQRERYINGKRLPDGWLFKATWSPDPPRISERTMKGRTIRSTQCRWKSDEHGVWYPIKSIGSIPFSGPVYNLSTPSHTYISQSYLVHNCDAANNDDLIDAGCTSLAEHAMTPSKIGAPDYQTAEFYFDFLKQTQDDDESGNDPSGGQPSSGDGEGQSFGEGKGQQSGDGKGQSSGYSSPGDDSDEEWAGCGSAAGGEKAPCELDPDDDANGAAPAANDAEVKIIDIATATEIKEYAAKHPGKTPRGLIEHAEQILKPSELGWRQILSSAVRRAAASRSGDFDTTYSRRNRRQSHRVYGEGSIIQPGIESPVPRLVIVRDTSGSMGADELSMVTNEVDGIAKQLGVRGENMIVLDVDAEVAATRKYRKASDLAEIAGRGGTNMCVGIEAAAVLRPAPSAIVVITDGWTPWPDVKTRLPVVACIVGSGAGDAAVLHSIPNWIIVVKVKEAN